MTRSQGLADQLCQKLRMVGLPKEVVLPLVNNLTKSIVCEGPENVVRRLKVLKQAAVNHLAGRPEMVVMPWIAHDRRGPKGPWRPVWAMLMSKQYKHRKRALNAMMVYASIVLPKRAGPTPTQERKFLSSVHHGEAERLLSERGVESLTNSWFFRSALTTLTGKLVDVPYQGQIPDFREWIAVKRGTDLRRLAADESQLSKFLGQDFGRAFQGFPEVKAALGEELVDDYRHLVHPHHGFDRDWRQASPPVEPVGVIGSSQEPGMKFRAFASPHMVLQCALVPLKDHLLKLLTLCPWDCTHDQDAGVAVVQKWLSTGKTVYSVDLSDATNNFPLAIQLKLLESLRKIPDSSIHLLNVVSRSPFKVMWTGENVSWDVGQPLGAGPSFPAFALGHALIALAAEKQAGVEPGKMGTTFLILGDDIVINDDQVHKHYRDILGTLRCPVSESKCLQSAICAEFAGKLVSKDYIFHGFKYKDVSDVSFMPIVRTLGRQALSRDLLTEDQYRYAKLLEHVPEPLGLGFNPEGRSYASRWEIYLHYKDVIEKRKPDPVLVSSAELFNRTMYTWSSRTSSSRYLYYFPKGEVVREVEKSTDLENVRALKARLLLNNVVKSEVIPGIRDQHLRSATMTSGDPRPNPLKDKVKLTTRIIAEIEEKVATPLHSKAEDPVPSIADGRTNLEREHSLVGADVSRLYTRLQSIQTGDCPSSSVDQPKG